jgi:hypothetical protein
LKRSAIAVLCSLLLISAAACVWISHRVDVNQVTAQNVTITSPVKAHLKDGSTIVYLHGATLSGGMLRGSGDRYDVTLAPAGRVDNISLADIAAMENFSTEVNTARTVVVSVLASVGVAVGSVALFKAIFGSCPTVYSGGGKIEEAELFSSSISPLFEARDTDRLQAQPDSSGVLHLELRNEAMETHYINHLQLLEVSHAADELVLPDEQGHPLIVGRIVPVEAAVSRDGQDLRATLGAADDNVYSTDRHIIDSAQATDMNDWIDIEATVPAGAKSVALVFRLRNSLLNTVLLYDMMLGRAGARALDWLATDLARISTAVELGRWYQQRAGLHISMWDGGGYREVTRVPDSGPIFWHDSAVVVPVRSGETSLRLRLSFVADQWRIDRVGIASSVREAMPRAIGIAEVKDADERINNEAAESLRAPDERYLQTTPGQRFFVSFNTGPAPAGLSRTFLLSSQGYYIEWIRGSWIQKASASRPFVPNDDAMLEALRQWSAERTSFEQEFMSARVPVH